MRSHVITESEVEQVALDILSELKYKVIYGPDIAPDGLRPERRSYADVILVDRLREAIDRFNPEIPAEAKDEAVKRILRTESPDLVINNHYFHHRNFSLKNSRGWPPQYKKSFLIQDFSATKRWRTGSAFPFGEASH